ncbi:MAG: DUF4386 domain-containing protein [Candidatus Krumholzibacteria bacterium]|nr:DUF4386 domain-containing protein [Candidatus Krumholzibacteria bacterium]
MNSVKATARRTGVLYFLFMIAAILGEFFFPAFMVSGDASATARNITAAEATYRITILTGFVTLVIFIVLVVSLYKLLKDVDKSQAMLMVLLVSVGVAVALANLLSKFAPLVLLSGADYLSVFTKPQLDALALGFLRFHSGGLILTMAFWGLWLFPFGILVIKSGFFPRVLGILLLVAGFAYLISSVTSLVLPDHRQVVSRIMMPLYFGEVPIIFWLLIKGAQVPQSQAQSSQVS